MAGGEGGGLTNLEVGNRKFLSRLEAVLIGDWTYSMR